MNSEESNTSNIGHKNIVIVNPQQYGITGVVHHINAPISPAVDSGESKESKAEKDLLLRISAAIEGVLLCQKYEKENKLIKNHDFDAAIYPIFKQKVPMSYIKRIRDTMRADKRFNCFQPEGAPLKHEEGGT